jgi:NTP pyrophosphatase (non-canonical NTP hydrolase)
MFTTQGKKGKKVSLRDLQSFVGEHHSPKKRNRQKYFLKLIEEVGELSEMIKEDKRLEPENKKVKAIKDTLEEETADVLYFLLALANTYGIDLEEAFIRKQRYKNKEG